MTCKSPLASAEKRRYPSRMILLRHMAIGLLAIALTVGTGWQSCATVQRVASAPVMAVDEMAPHQTMEHHDHQHHQMASPENNNAQTPISSNAADPGFDSHACLKCCGACMLGSIAVTAPEWTITRVVTRIAFSASYEQLRGHIVFVDPDIPKSAV